MKDISKILLDDELFQIRDENTYTKAEQDSKYSTKQETANAAGSVYSTVVREYTSKDESNDNTTFALKDFKFTDESSYLPAPDSRYIPGATGKWEDKADPNTSFTSAEIASISRTAPITYVAEIQQ